MSEKFVLNETSYFGRGSRVELANEIKTRGFKKILVVTDQTLLDCGVTGKVTTGIIKIPKLRLMSDLSMRVGSDAIPQVGRLDAVAVPEGVRGQSKVMELTFLNDDIDADMW